jgi:hypothetical protein
LEVSCAKRNKLLVTETKELYPEAEHPRLISGNGSRFISKDFKELLIMLEIGRVYQRHSPAEQRQTGTFSPDIKNRAHKGVGLCR